MRGEGVDTPVIVISAKGGEIDRVVGLKVGADDYVAKPFSRPELLARVEAVLRRQRRAESQGGDERWPADPQRRPGDRRGASRGDLQRGAPDA